MVSELSSTISNDGEPTAPLEEGRALLSGSLNGMKESKESFFASFPLLPSLFILPNRFISTRNFRILNSNYFVLVDVPTADKIHELTVFLDATFQSVHVHLSSFASWAPAVDILVANGVAWTNAVVDRAALRVEYVTQIYIS